MEEKKLRNGGNLFWGRYKKYDLHPAVNNKK